MKTILTLMILVASTAFGLESIPARWHQGLSSTYLTDYHKGEHLIISDVWTGTPSVDATVKHSLQVRVSAWNKPFSAIYESPDKRQNEVLTVTLHEMADPKEMRAEFDHVISEDGTVTLRFSGVTILARPN